MPDPYLAPPPHKNDPKGVAALKELLWAQGHWKHATSGPWGGALTEAVTYFQQTHIGKDGLPLKTDGEVGDKTWWALRNAEGKKQRNGMKAGAKIPAGIGVVRTSLLKKALSEHAKGVKETPNGSNRGKHVDKYFPKWLIKKMGKGKGEAWCAFFINWLVTEVIGKRPWGGYIGSCYALYKASKKKGLACYTAPARVRPGDVGIMFKTNPDKKRPKGGHIFLVLRVSADGSEVNTVEGNCGNRVKVGWRRTKDVSRFINFCGDSVPVGFERGVITADDVGRHGTR